MKTKKKLVRGKSWHGWAWKDENKIWSFFADYKRPSSENQPTNNGKWVRVRFLEVK